MKLNVISCGGCGISVADKVVTKIAELGEGFAAVEQYYIDSSVNNIKDIEHDSQRFFKITSRGVGAGEIAGAGGNRTNNIQDVSLGVQEFLNKYKFTKPVTGEYVVVIFSGSGGSGSNIGSLMLKELMIREIPVVAIMVGDSSSGESCVNTVNTLSGLDKIAKGIQKSLSLLYVNNHNMVNKNPKKESEINTGVAVKEDKANEKIFHFLTGLSLFASGVNESIDYSDIKIFLTPHNVKTFKTTLSTGVYNIEITGDITDLPDDFDVIMARSLTADKEAGVDLKDTMLVSHKAGRVVTENAIDTYKGKFPLYLVNAVNYLQKEVDKLNDLSSNMANIAKGIDNKTITSAIGDEDEFGLIV